MIHKSEELFNFGFRERERGYTLLFSCGWGKSKIICNIKVYILKKWKHFSLNSKALILRVHNYESKKKGKDQESIQSIMGHG